MSANKFKVGDKVRVCKISDWKPVQSEEAAPETIEIGGKKYNKQEFEEAVKDLEPID